MELPKDKKIHELRGSWIWFGEDGIVYSKPKPDAPTEQTNEEITEEMKKLRVILGNNKVCMVTESAANSRPPQKEQRDFIASEIASVVKALALIATSPLSRMLANLFFSFKPPSYPVKLFSNEKEATEWIRQYL